MKDFLLFSYYEYYTSLLVDQTKIDQQLSWSEFGRG